MNPWPFVIAAYAVSIAGTAALCWSSWRAMRRAEKRADQMKRGD
jgi:threonine/homoserine/homoserine lactone efflux protein